MVHSFSDRQTERERISMASDDENDDVVPKFIIDSETDSTVVLMPAEQS